jgi:Kef-type K+ transport system membrane component KefB
MHTELISLLHELKPSYILLVQACIIVLVPYLLWRTARLGTWFPLGVIQIFAGVLLGPSLFGAVDKDLFDALFGLSPYHGHVINRADGIASIATIAVCLFGFLAGADADKEVIAKSGRTVVAIGVLGMLTGWATGIVAGWFLYATVPAAHCTPVNVAAALPCQSPPQFSFALAYGLVIAVSALPVLALILRELKLTQRRIGAVALASSGLADTMMWMGLALVSGLAGIGGSVTTALITAVLGGALAVGFIKFVAHPLLNALIKSEAPEGAIMTATALSIFVSSAITGISDLHPVLGAFIAGVFLPDKVRDLAAHKLDLPTTLVLMPFFFLNTGLGTRFLLGDPAIWLLFGISTFLCVAGKVLGHGLAARMSGETWPFSVGIGILLQSKGLMGLIVIVVFRDRGIVTDLMFSAAVLMCMVSTGLTTPVMRWLIRIYGDRLLDGAKAEVPEVRPGGPRVAEAPAASKDARPVAVLKFTGGYGEAKVMSPRVLIGRHSEDTIRINDIRVSRHHALLTEGDGGQFEIFNQTADRSDPNPILINGVEKEHSVLNDGDLVSLGGVEFIFRRLAAA